MKQNGQGKNIFRVSLSLAVAIALCCITSCTPGMGEEIDLEGPSLSITSHKNLDYVGKTLVLSGNCYDNRAVTRIDVVNVGSGASYPDVQISNGSWSISLSLPEGEQNIRVTAFDANNNSSYDSVKQVTLLVDATDPFMESIEILRPSGYTAPLISLESLKQKEITNPSDVDYFQNESFSVRGAVVENFVVSSVLISVYDESGNLVLERNPDTGVSLSSPVFTITHADLVAVNPSYASGRRYFRITATTADEGNINTDQFLWFCWYPESDTPKIIQTSVSNGKLTVPKDTSIPFTFFDDDAIAEVYAKVVSVDAWNAVAGTSNEAKFLTLISNSTARTALLGADLLVSDTRSWNTSVVSGNVNGTYRLVILALDTKAPSTIAGVWASDLIELSVTDQDAPLPVIESPLENTFPTLSAGSSYTFSGYVLDNTGADSVQIAWIPFGIPGGPNSRISEAESVLKNSTISMGSMATDSSGIKIWNVTLGTAEALTISTEGFSRTFSKRPFLHTFNVLTDFMYNGTIENEVKVFVIRCTDVDGNEVFQTFRLKGDTTTPLLSIQPASDLQVFGLDEDLVLSFSATKTNGLAIATYTIEDITDQANPVSLPLTVSSFNRQTTLASSLLSEGRRTYRFSAVDVLGGTIVEQRTVILTSLPELEHITSGEMDGTYGLGSSISVQAVFSKPVKVTGTPRLDLRFNATDTVPKYATYVSGTGTDTLVFSYSVQTGDTSALLISASAPIDLHGAQIETSEGSGGNAFIAGLNSLPGLLTNDSLQGSKLIAIDGIAPTLTGINIHPSSGSIREGDSISITLTTSENVFISGSPVLSLGGGIVVASFQTTGVNTITFVYTIQSGDDTPNLSYNLGSCISLPHTALIKDAAGNTLSLSNTTAGVLGVLIDTIAPVAPTLSLVSGNYSSQQTLTLTGIESGAASFYSINGGITWLEYSSPVVFGNGTYTVTSYQVDEAGNTSPPAAPVTLTIKDSFPNITSLSCEQPNGVYSQGAVLTFKLAFAELVRTTAAGSFLILSNGDSAEVVAEPSGSKVLYFSYTVPAGKTMDPVAVSSMNLSTIEDVFGNTTVATVPPVFSRPLLKVDSLAPSISSFTPAHLGALALSAGNSILTFSFSEDVFVESGTITVSRRGNWLIPPVLSESDFQKVYYSSALSIADRELLMETQGGLARLDPISGQAVGPYIKTTHGLVAGSGAPDTATKYVLAFDTDIDNAALRTVFEKTGYHMQTVDVTSFRVEITASQVQVTLPFPLPPGREWDVSISAGAFRDIAGNQSAALVSGSYRFWSDMVATPVIRLDRYSYGSTMRETAVGSGVYEVSPSPTTAPSGIVRVRIDCETPGALIFYGEKNDIAISQATAASLLTAQADASSADLTGIPLGASYTGAFNAGDGNYTTAQKIYIGARATLATLQDSQRGYEGAFKTVVVYWNPNYENNLVLQGSTVQGGMPTISGFPLRDADPDNRYSKFFYKLSATEFYWNTWEIVSSWAMQGKRDFPGGNWQQGYNAGNYGQVTSRNTQLYW